MGLRVQSGTWHYRFIEAGKPYCGTTGLKATARNAAKAAATMERHRQMVLGGQEAVQDAPFSEAAAAFLSWSDGEHRGHPNTARRLRTSFVSLMAFFGAKLLSAVRPGDVEDYKTWRRSQGIKEITIRHDLHALAPFFRYARRQGWCDRNPMEDVAIPSDRDAVRVHVFTDDEERRYFEAASRFRDLWDLCRLMRNQGCRPDELLSLEKRSVDLVGRTLRIERGKTPAARRTLHLTAESVAVLGNRMGTVGPWVFPCPGGAAAVLSVNHQHATVRKTTGIPCVIYDWRHTFATRAAAAGVDLATLAAILGHSGLRAVTKYVHPTQQTQRAAMRLLDQGGDRIETRVN